MTASTAKVRPLVAPLRRGRTSDSGSGGDQVERPFISSAMLAIMMVIASEMMLFSGLIGTFLVYRMSSAFWPPPSLPRLPIAVTWVNTFVLLSSAVTMTLALRAVHHSRQRLTRRYLLATLALGVTFLAVQGSEWVRLVAHGLTDVEQHVRRHFLSADRMPRRARDRRRHLARMRRVVCDERQVQRAQRPRD